MLMLRNIFTKIKDDYYDPFLHGQEKPPAASSKEYVHFNPNYLEVENVRVYPQKIYFKNPYEGKQFEEKLKLINCGEKLAFVRILQPTSSHVSMKEIKEGQFIPAGLSITRTIKYVANMATIVPTILIPIYINEKVLNYKIEINLSKVDFVVEPDRINFGVINVGPTASKRTIKLTNIGGKTGRFSIDLGHNELNVFAKPLRGVLTSNTHVLIDVEMNLYTEGKFNTEFWIVSENPICVKVFGDAVIGKIEAVYKFAMKSFTFLNFPCTYYGLKSSLGLPLRSKSQIHSAFCVTGENDLRSVPWDSNEIDFKYFNIEPMEGRLPPNDIRPFIITFFPQKNLRKLTNNKDYILAIMRINQLYCKDLSTSLKNENIFNIKNASLSKHQFSESGQSIQSITEFSFAGNFSEESNLSIPDISALENYFETTVRVMLYGVPEHASLTAVPNELILNDVVLKQTEKRILKLTNNSKNLPIYFQYQKIKFVEIVPKMGFLEVSKSIEVQVLVTAQSYDIENSSIKINLLYYDNPRLDTELKVVGCHEVPIRLHPKIISKQLNEGITVDTFDFKKPFCKPKLKVLKVLKDEKALLGLPNDCPASLRAWKSSKPCRTLYAGLPRITNVKDDYELSYTEINLKKSTRKYYQKFIREEAESIRLRLQSKNIISKFDDYDILTKEKCFLYFNNPKILYTTKSFIPLTPSQLYKFQIIPRNSFIDNVLPYSSIPHSLKIINSNDVAVRVFFKPQNDENFNFLNGNRLVVNPQSSKDISFLCFSHLVGIQNYILNVIVNEDMVFETSITIHVKPKELKYDPFEINFEQNDPQFKFIEFFNVYNSVIDFKWDYLAEFKVFPDEGVVLPGKSLICMLSYEIGTLKGNNYELNVIMGKSRNVTIRVKVYIIEFKATIPNKLQVGTIPSSIPTYHDMYFKNESNCPLNFEINATNLEHGFNIAPLTGKVQPKCLQKLTVEINSDNCGDIKSEFEVIVGRNKRFTVQIIGRIQFPKLVFSPESIRFKKIAASSYDCKTFTIKNVDQVTSVITFDPEKYTEIFFSEYLDKKITPENNVIRLEPNQEKKFLIHQFPLNPVVTSFHIPIKVNNSNIYENKFQLPTKLYLAVLTPKILINSWTYNFNFFPYYNYKSNTHCKITITNPSAQNEVTFCIRTDKVQIPYSLTHISGGQIVYYDFSTVVVLGPNEKVIFEAQFNPENPGFYQIKIPLFVKDDFFEEPHNYISFNGEYFEPKLSFEQRCVYFGLLPFGVTSAVALKLNMEYHKPDCDIKIIYDNGSCLEVTITYPDAKLINTVATVNFEYSSDTCHSLETIVKLKCTCKVEINIPCYGSFVNCFLTIHACVKYIQVEQIEKGRVSYNPLDELMRLSSPDTTSNLNLCYKAANLKLFFDNSLPNFPDCDTSFGEYMNETVQIMENWMYEQAFFGKSFYKIPDNMVIYEFSEERPDLDNAKHDTYILLKKAIFPIHKLLTNLCGSYINRVVSNIINEEVLFCVWLKSYYSSIINFITSLGGLISHIQPEDLLDYKNYKNYKIARNDSENMVSAESFEKTSKLVWLDLLIQVYRVLVYKRLVTHPVLNKSFSALSIDTKKSSKFYSIEDKLLLSWLEDNLKKQNNYLVESAMSFIFNDDITSKSILYFDKDLNDGVAFLAVTINYCPYLVKYLNRMFILPVSKEEYFHNACTLIKVWKMLRMSFRLSPYDIINGHPVKMVLFSAYLYDFMENIRPKDTINLMGPLGEITKENIKVTNECKDPINYEVVFFENQEGVFSVKSKSVVVPPLQTINIELSFYAKFAKLYEGVMILSGENYGHKFSQSQAFLLSGKPTLKEPSVDLSLSTEAYVFKKHLCNVQSPYRQKACYKIYITLKDSVTYSTTWTPYDVLIKSVQLSRISTTKSELETNDDGLGVIDMKTCAVTNQSKSVWVLLKNETVGDFLVRVTLHTRPSSKFFKIDLTLDEKVFSNNCSCPGGIPDYRNNKCPKTINVPIPSRNELLWSTVMEKFLEKADNCEKHFWSTYQGTTVGLNVMKRNLNDAKSQTSEEMQYIFKENIVYNVKIKTRDVVGQKKITIEKPGNINETTNLVLHINLNTVNLITILLESEDKLETRLYKIYLKF